MQRDKDSGPLIKVFSSISEMDRRRFLRGAAGLAGAGLLLGCGIAPVRQSGVGVKADPDEASAIRREIREFEAANWDDVSTSKVVWIYGKITELHTATFGLPQIKTTLVAFGHDALGSERMRELGLSQLRQEVPWGDASALGANSATLRPDQVAQSGIVLLYTGKENIKDSNINKLSIVRVVAQHEHIHAQTKFLKPGKVMIDGVPFEVTLQRGFKWVTNEPRDNQKAWYFDEVNTQLLAEFMNDPKGEDDIYERMLQSKVYNSSISWIEGASALRNVYRGLCIPEGEVRPFHFEANPQGMLNQMDAAVTRHNLVLPQRASSALIRLNPNQGDEASRVRVLQELAEVARNPGQPLIR